MQALSPVCVSTYRRHKNPVSWMSKLSLLGGRGYRGPKKLKFFLKVMQSGCVNVKM